MDPDLERKREKIVAILIGAILSIIVARTIAFAVPFRLRPIYDPALTHPVYSVAFTPNIENWSAFPSDTAAYFFALAFGLARLSRRLAIPIVLYTLVWICLPRVYLGLHNASDIVAGIAIGTTAVWISLRSDFLRSIVARRLLAAMKTRPQWFYAIAFIVSFEMATVFAGVRNAGNGLLHMVGLHLGSVHAGYGSPIDEWEGAAVMSGLLATIACAVCVLHYKSGRADTGSGEDSAGP